MQFPRCVYDRYHKDEENYATHQLNVIYDGGHRQLSAQKYNIAIIGLESPILLKLRGSSFLFQCCRNDIQHGEGM